MTKEDRIQATKLLSKSPDFDDSNDSTDWLRTKMDISDKDLDIIFAEDYDGR